jgi:hypothetical protein
MSSGRIGLTAFLRLWNVRLHRRVFAQREMEQMSDQASVALGDGEAVVLRELEGFVERGGRSLVVEL